MTDALDAFAEQLVAPRLGVLDGLRRIDALLVSKGWPAISPWWWVVLVAFLTGWTTATLRRLVARVGRRGGKSTTMCRLAVALALYGSYEIPKGDTGIVAFVSVKMSEARERLATIAQILDSLGEPYDSRGDELRLRRRPIAFRVYPASFRTSVGFTGIALFADEVARWRDDDTGANPAHHVFASMRPSLATVPNAVEVVVSSPWATLDYHYELCKAGTTEEQLFCEAPSWVANPVTMSEERARQLEPDAPTRQREYGGPGTEPPQPMTSDESTFYDAGLVERAEGPLYEPAPGDVLTAGADFGFTRNFSALAVVALRPTGHRRLVRLERRRPQGAPLKPSVVIAEFGRIAAGYGIRLIMGDQHYRASIDEHLPPTGCNLLEAPSEPERAHVATRVLLAQGLLSGIDAQLSRNLKETKGRPLQSGRISVLLPSRKDGSHADDVAALVLACYQDLGHEVEADEQRDAEYEAYLGKVQRERDEGWTDEAPTLLDYDDGW